MLDLFAEPVEAPPLSSTPAVPDRQPVRRWTEVFSINGRPPLTLHRAIWPNGVMTEEREIPEALNPKKQSPTEVGLW